jgi:glutamate dehydrogenase (NAD(P)+)
VRIQKMTSSTSFVLFDLPDAPTSTGPVRLAPKVLPSSSGDLARAITYAHALVGQHIGGAAAGIDSPADDRAAALAAFLAEVEPLVAAGTFLPDPGRGVSEADLAPLRAVDRRSADLWAPASEGAGPRDRAVAAGAVAAAEVATGGLSGRTVALDGAGGAAVAFAERAVAAGARLVAVTTGSGSVRADEGIDPADLRRALAGGEPEALVSLGVASEVGARAAGADVLAVTAPVGAYDHGAVADVAAGVLVPLSPLVLTARGLAVTQRAGTTALPDFLTMAGDALAATTERLDEDALVAIGETVGGIAAELAGAPEGWFLAAALRAEAFLRTWRDVPPFGRPLAP